MSRLITVIVCTWNRAESLRTTLLSLQQQALPDGLAVEVIVVDNNSQDGTRAAVEAMQGGWQVGALRYLFEARQGKQFALNTGIGASAGQVLAFTDDDILFPAGWIAAIDRLFAAGPVELAGGKTLLSWPDTGIPPWYADSMQAILGGVDLGEQLLAPPPAGYAPAGANLVARRSLFDKVGAFSEAHFRHMDYEFGLRAAAAGVAVVYDPALLVWAPVDPGMLSLRYFRRWSFKAGFGAAGRGMASFMGVPFWIYRRLLQDLLAWPFERLLRAPDVAFARELRIWRGWGAVASSWYEKMWPRQYPQWVERYSQKKKNLY